MARRPENAALWLVGSAVCALALAGCSDHRSDQPAPLAIAGISGKSMADVSGHIRSETTLLVQQPSLGAKDAPLYDGSQQTSTRWIVLAGCSDQKTLDESSSVEVSVIPEEDYDDAMRSRAASGDLSDTVTCEGRTYRSHSE